MSTSAASGRPMPEPSPLRSGIAEGKFRVIYVDLFSHEDGIVKDAVTQEEAFALADEHNKGRTGSMDDVYYVYDDQGKYVRGPEAVGSLGVSP